VVRSPHPSHTPSSFKPLSCHATPAPMRCDVFQPWVHAPMAGCVQSLPEVVSPLSSVLRAAGGVGALVRQTPNVFSPAVRTVTRVSFVGQQGEHALCPSPHLLPFTHTHTE
jgi:hypothetical protein